jgi:lipoprotein-releasing system ATP-binding protein
MSIPPAKSRGSDRQNVWESQGLPPAEPNVEPVANIHPPNLGAPSNSCPPANEEAPSVVENLSLAQDMGSGNEPIPERELPTTLAGEARQAWGVGKRLSPGSWVRVDPAHSSQKDSPGREPEPPCCPLAPSLKSNAPLSEESLFMANNYENWFPYGDKKGTVSSPVRRPETPFASGGDPEGSGPSPYESKAGKTPERLATRPGCAGVVAGESPASERSAREVSPCPESCRSTRQPGSPAAVEVAIEACNISKSYTRGGSRVEVLRQLELRVFSGEFVAIVGQSGSGKSTLLHLLATLDRPDEGEVFYRGERIDHLPSRQRDRLRNRHFGMVFQMYHLLPELTALENVMLPLMIPHGPLALLTKWRAIRGKALQWLRAVGLAHRAYHKPRELSGGEMQRVAIARALVHCPEILFADEPTGNLDRHTGWEILKLLRSLNKEENLTIVMVTHDPQVAGIADRIVRLYDGRIVPVCP